MKKAFVTLVLLLAICTSILAGTMAVYTTQLEIGSGSVVAKEFIFLGEGAESFGQNVKIAPTETVNWNFSVKNYDGSYITETDLYYKLEFFVSKTEGKIKAIEPLIISIKDGAGNLIKSIETNEGEGSAIVYGTFPLSNEGQSEAYNVEVYWPSTDNDINFAGHDYGTSINVTAIASQIPFGGSEPGGGGPGSGEPGGGDIPEEPEDSGIVVRYRSTEPYNDIFYYDITIVNNSGITLRNWEIMFDCEDSLVIGWPTGFQVLSGYPNYHIKHPEYWKDIKNGESVQFGGNATGTGNRPITSVKIIVDGNVIYDNIVPICEYNLNELSY